MNCVGKLKLACVKDTTTVVKHVGKLWATNKICLYSPQLEFANGSLPTLVCRVKAALEASSNSVRSVFPLVPY